MDSVRFTRDIPIYKHYDVVVCGAGPAGICAAVAAARAGAKVALLERYGAVGGCLTLGYVAPVAGMVGKGTMRQEVCDLLGVGDNDAYAWTGVCHDIQKAKTVLTEFVDHENIEVYLQTMVSDVWMDGDTIRGVVVSTKEGLKILSGTVIIDATGDGDVAEFAGCEIEKGRDDGLMQPVTLEFLVGDVAEDGIICIGDISDVQFKGKRFLDWCKEQAEQGVIPKNAAAVRMCPTVNKGERHFNTTQVNGVDSTKVETLFKAELELRRQITTLVDFFRNNLPGYENCKYIGSGTTLGVRESRRVVGEYYITAEELVEGKRFEDVIVHNAEFLVDIHNPTGSGQAEAKIQYCKPYDLPYGCFVPKKIDGLFTAGRCISGTHRAHASYRVMSICMAMGQAIGVAAAMCAQRGCTPRQLNVKDLQKELLALGIELFDE